MEAPQPANKVLFILLAGLIWYTSSILVNITWKQVFYKHPHVISLTFIQVAVAQLTVIPFLIFTWLKDPQAFRSVSEWPTTRVLLIGVSFGFGQLCTNASLSLVSVSLTHVIKISEPLIALLFGVTILKDKVPSSAMIYMVFLLVGVGVTTVQDTSFHYTGIAYAGMSNIALQIRNLNVKLLKAGQEEGINSTVLFALSNGVSVIAMVCLLLLQYLFAGYTALIPDLDVQAALTGMYFSAQHIMSYFVLQHVLLSTHALLNVTKRLSIIVISSVILHTPLSAIQFLGIGMALTGFYLYTMAMSTKDSSALVTLSKSNKCTWIVFILTILALGSILHIPKGAPLHMLNQRQQLSNVSLGSAVHMPTEAPLHVLDQPQQPPVKTSYDVRPITAFWTYTKKLDDSSIHLLSSLSEQNPPRKITVYCGSSTCRKSLENVTKVEVKQLQILSISSGTTISGWLRRHALMKILTGPKYEQYLQKAINLALLWKVGGIVLDLDLPVTDRHLFASKLADMKNNTCILGYDTLPLGICNLNERHPFVENVMRKFVSAFEIKPTDVWPHSVDLMGMLDAMLKSETQPGQNKNLPIDTSKKFVDILGPAKNHDSEKSFGLIHYLESDNIGDEVQSIASAHFLPRVDVLLPRDKPLPPLKKETTVLMNAFWRHYSWLYQPMTNIYPVTVAMHVTSAWNSASKKKWIENKSFFAKFSNIGTRDTTTLDIFKEIGIPAQMTGCMTPFIQNPFQGLPRTDKIYFVDVDKYMEKLIPAHITANATIIKQVVSREESNGMVRYVNAYNRIEKYAQAKLIITTRIHCALPCVALGTPVIFLNLKTLNDASPTRESVRVSGLTELFHGINEYTQTTQEIQDFFNKFNYNDPPPNPNSSLADTYRNSAWTILQKVDELKDTHTMYELRP